MKAVAGLLLAVAAGAAEAEEPPICADRPAKGNAVCTVPAGKIQIETGAIDWTLTKDSGVRTEMTLVGSSFVKLGLSDRSDIEIGITPYERMTMSEGGSHDSVAGFGDTTVRYKQRLIAEGAKVEAALIPFIKVPTAKHNLGNGEWEGGLAVPIGFNLGGDVMLTLGPELDLLADDDGSGHHVGVVNLVNLGVPVTDKLNFAAELWSNVNFDPARTQKQASADAALAYAVSTHVQADVGANFGLNHDTPDVELYGGLSVRF